ncbi:ATP-binding protein [Xanthomonas maliensis]|uniref:ATP-binding protein n=1 Tax=Xanthomonas maliensis TaxID=1321368 RepID=UPI0003A26B1C|nr:ATP-binding protein [Xanthomonas maliensis]KAB7770830.1 ATP-binding protein [Xanthomonas maliensis]
MEVSFAGAVTQVIRVEETTQVGQVRRHALALAQGNGFDEDDCGRVALVATELSTNVLTHGGGGHVQLALTAGREGVGVEVCTIDAGPGFDLARCLADGYSTGTTPGIGLGTVQRQADVLDAYSDAAGAVVLARMYAANGAGNGAGRDLPYGALRIPLQHELECGDAWHLQIVGTQVTATMIDGLGHGPAAAAAADAGVQAAALASGEPGERLTRLHASMSGTRGGAVAVGCFDADSGQLRFAGVGNITAALCDGEGVRSLMSHPGIVGVQFRKTVAGDLRDARGRLLVLHSDGLQSRWNLRDHAGLLARHPRIIAAVLLRDHQRGRDDCGVFVMRLGDLQ